MASPRPRVRIVGTGGTIAGVGPHRLDYFLYVEMGRFMPIEESLARVPEVHDVAEIEAENIVSVRSIDLSTRDWIGMAQRINQIFEDDPGLSGVVVTHGTATLEGTAYFLHLTVKPPKPVVITGSMRPASALSTDADLNLLDAVRIAASPAAVGKGVLTALNNEIHSARDVTKSNTFRVETFRPNELGFLGYCDSDGEVLFYRTPIRKHTVDTPFDVSGVDDLPRVDIVYSYVDADGLLVDAVRQNGSDGLIISGFGAGLAPPAVWEAGAQAVKDGIPVVLASRATAGRVVMTPRMDELGFIVCDNLLPQKARILLKLALSVTRDREEIQQMFYQF